MQKTLNKCLAVLLLFSALMGFFTLQSQSVPQDDTGYGVAKAEDTLPAQIVELPKSRDVQRTTHVFLIKKEVPKIPLYKQTDYPNVPYGSYGSIASHGCGITCLAMVATYLSDEIYTPPQLAKQFGHYKTDRGSMWILFEDSAKKLDIDLQERTSDTKKVVKALKNGQIVIALQSTGLFTGSGHFIVLTGIKDNGRITVNDPNAGNYQKNSTLINGFKNGFSQSEVFANGGPYWIYEKKGT